MSARGLIVRLSERQLAHPLESPRLLQSFPELPSNRQRLGVTSGGVRVIAATTRDRCQEVLRVGYGRLAS